MATFDYDVVIIGSGFGGSVAALRAAEKGYRVGVMEAGRRWEDADLPESQWHLPGFLWFPAAELYGIQRVEYLDDVLVLCGAGVGGDARVWEESEVRCQGISDPVTTDHGLQVTGAGYWLFEPSGCLSNAR